MFHIFLSVFSVIVHDFQNDSFCKKYCCAVFFEQSIDCTEQRVWYNTDNKYRSFMCNTVWTYKPMLENNENDMKNWKPIPNVKYVDSSCPSNVKDIKLKSENSLKNFPMLTGRSCRGIQFENASLEINVRPESVCENILSAISNLSWPNFCQDGRSPEWKVDFDVEGFDFEVCVPSYTNQAFYKGWNTFSVTAPVIISNSKHMIPDGTIVKAFESLDYRVTTYAMEVHKQNGEWITPNRKSDILLSPGVGYFLYTPENFIFEYASRNERIPSSTNIEITLYPGWNAFALKKNVIVDVFSLNYKRGMFSEGDYIKNVESFDHHTPLNKIDDFQRKNGQWEARGSQAIPVFHPQVGYLIYVQREIEFSY